MNSRSSWAASRSSSSHWALPRRSEASSLSAGWALLSEYQHLQRLALLLLPPGLQGFDADRAAAVLVAEGVIDGAIVSSLCQHQPFQASRLPQWEGVRAVPLATMELQLVCHQRWQGDWDEAVLLPSAEVMPLLHQQLAAAGSELEVPPRTCQEPAMWLEQLQQRPVALPVCPALAPASGWQEQGVVWWPTSRQSASGCGCCCRMRSICLWPPEHPCG